MPLMGQRSQNPGGSQGLNDALQRLSQQAQAGDQRALATIQDIAAGRTTAAGAVPGWNESINWGAADTGHGNTGGRAADRALAGAYLQGDQGAISSIEANKAATRKDWTGGDLAKYGIPLAVGLATGGMGLPVAAGLGAAAGALGSATGVTNDSVLGAAGRGAAVGAAGGGVRNLIGGNNILTGQSSLPAAPGAIDTASLGNQAVADSGAPLPGSGLAEGMANTMRNSPAISGGYTPNFGSGDVASTPTASRSLLSRIGGAVGGAGRAALGYAAQHPATVLQGGLAALGTIQGAQQQGEADTARRQALNLGLGDTDVDLGDQYTDQTNPYAVSRTGVNPARRSALRSLMSAY